MTRTHKEVTPVARGIAESPACLGPDGSASKVARALRVVSGRWKLAILFNLFASPRLRFHELAKALVGVSHRMLTLRLRELKTDGVIRRTVRREKPLEVDYALTDRGRALRPILRSFRDWSL